MYTLNRQSVAANVHGTHTIKFNRTTVKLPADFSDLRMLYKIASTVPITTASVERGFSKLAYVKNKLRSTMMQDRVESLILATAENDVLLQLSNEDLVAKFAGAADRRLDLG